MSWLDSFMVRAALAGVGVAIAAAPLGCFVIWRRMAYIGDATSHAAILGVALSLMFSISVFPGVLFVAILMGITISYLGQRDYAVDTLLGVLAYSALALGLVGVSLLPNVRVDLMAYLFGDILAVGKSDLWIIWGGGLLIVGLIWWRWSALLTSSVSPELAFGAGLNPKKEQFILTILLAVVVAVALKVVGALLISAMLIIPAAAARPFSRAPEAMALIAALLGTASALGGLQLAFVLDTPAGPTIVCVAAFLFVVSNLIAFLRRL